MSLKQITIKDIAKKAGVSGTTVSRYLNGKFEYMSTQTKSNIGKVIEELNYRPSNIARTLKSNKSMLIGAVIADIENPFSNQIIKGLTDKADEMGYSLMISISNNTVDKEREGIERFLDNRVDGLVVNTVGENEEFLKNLQNKLPIVLIDRGGISFQADTVSSNNYQLGIQMMEHLVENRFQSIAFFSEVTEHNTVRKFRHQAFLDVVKNKKDINAVTYIVNLEDSRQMEENLKEFYSFQGPRVIFASNGLVLQSILKIMKKTKYKLGKDFSVCGYDNLEWTSFVGEDGITTIAQDSYSLGTETATLICKRINKELQTKEPININVKGHLILRGSTQYK